jgi:transposase
METVPVFVGLDYHSKSVQVCVVDGAGRVLLYRRCGNDPAEVAACVMQQREVGPVTAWTMRALSGRFDRFANGKQLGRFCPQLWAVTPCNASSGQRVADSGMVRAGDRQRSRRRSRPCAAW